MDSTEQRWQSLRVRLPVLLCAAMIGILGVFLWTTNRALEQVLMRAGGERAQAAADQLAGLLTQSLIQSGTEARRIAGDATLHQFLTDRSPEHAAAAKHVLAKLARAGQPPVRLWDADGTEVLLQVEPEATDGASQPSTLAVKELPPRGPGLTPFRIDGTHVLYDFVIDIEDRLGHVVVSRALSTAQTRDTIGRLVGNSAGIAVGNQRGDVWSDFSKPIPTPVPDTTTRGIRTRTGADGTARLGATSVVANTPWAVWVDFPQNLILAPAHSLVGRMLGLAALFVLVAALLAAVASARITTPLQRLTRASEAIAAGRFDERVPAMRRDEIGRLGTAFNIMAERVASAHRELEDRVAERTRELEDTVSELEAFSYSVSHDLRAPLRHVSGFVMLLEQSLDPSISDTSRRHLKTIAAAAQRMGVLIDDLLAFSRAGRAPMSLIAVDLNVLVRDIQDDLRQDINGRAIEWVTPPLPTVSADAAMLRLVLTNLLSNAVKYTRGRNPAVIEVTATRGAKETIVSVRDNGVGFEMQYVNKLFGVFQRLHRQDEFEGTGIGLANVRRIISRHGGRTWAEGHVGQGAVFSFSLPDSREA